MNICKVFLFCLFSQMLFAGEWSITFENRETDENSTFHPTSKDYFFPERTNHEWQCLIKKEEITPLTTQRLVMCATKNGNFIDTTLVCDNLSFKVKDGNDSHLFMPEPCVDELELKDLGPPVPNIKVIIKYEWWK